MSRGPAPGLHGALLRYRVMAFAVGVMLVVLVFVGIPLQIAGHPAVVQIVGPIHGFLYIVYLVQIRARIENFGEEHCANRHTSDQGDEQDSLP